MSVFVTGDIHGDPRKFSSEIFPEQKQMTKDDVVIICGDFGLCWNYLGETKEEKYFLNWLDSKSFTTVFVDGNHENFDRLYQYPVKEWNGGKVHELRPSILHLMRGEVFDIQGFKFFAFGGASSHDIDDGIIDDPDWKTIEKKWYKNGKRYFRIKNVSWWEEELPSKEEYENALKNLEKYEFKVDFVVSHCLPSSIQFFMSQGEYLSDHLTDFFQDLVTEHHMKFSGWFAGHYHRNQRIFSKFYILYEQILQVA